MRLPDEVLGQLRTGDLILASDRDEPVSVVDDVRGPGWSKVGVVVRPTDFGVPAGPRDVLVYSPEEDELATLASRVEPLPELTGTVVMCALDRRAAGQAVEGIAGRIGVRTRIGGGDPLGNRLRNALAGRSASLGIVELPDWPGYLDPSPLNPRRTCGEPGCHYQRPCPVHG